MIEYEKAPKADRDRYFLTMEALSGTEHWMEVSKLRYGQAERNAGFRNHKGNPDEPATGSFSDGIVRGYICYKGSDLPKRFVAEVDEEQEAVPVVPPQVERLGKSLDSLVRVTFPEGSYHYQESAEGTITVVLTKAQCENLNKAHSMLAVQTIVLRLQKAVEELQGIETAKEPMKVLKGALKTFLGSPK